MSAAGPRAYNRRRVMAALAIGLGVVAFGGVCVFLVSFQQSRNDNLFATLMIGVLWTGISLACLAGWRRRGVWRVPAVLGVALITIGCGLMLLLVWNYFSGIPWRDRVPIERSTAGIVTAAVLMGYICLIGLARLSRRWQWVRVATIGSGFALAAYIIAIIIRNISETEAMPVLGTLIITTGCGTLCVVLLHWVGASAVQEPAVTTPMVIRLVCPRCGDAQELPAGRARCRTCRLTLCIQIEEEHCATCGYLLYRLTSDRCPECGTPIAWAAPATAAAAPPAAPPSPPPPAA